MTKHPSLHEDALKNTLTIEDVKVPVVPKMVDDSMLMGTHHLGAKSQNKMKVAMGKPKAPAKKTSRLCKATQHLYDLEGSHAPEKSLNVDFGLYQMEDY